MKKSLAIADRAARQGALVDLVLELADRVTLTVRETEAEAIAFVVSETIGLNAGRVSAEKSVRTS